MRVRSKHKKYIAILLFLFSIIGCSRSNKVFHQVVTKEGDFDLYIVPSPELAKEYNESSQFLLNYAYKIDSSDIVKEFVEAFTYEDTSVTQQIYPYFMLEIAKDNRTYSSRWLNAEFTIVLYKHFQSVEPSVLLEYQSHFEPLMAHIITIRKLDDARKSINIIQDNGGFLTYHNDYIPYHWEKYSGKIELRCLKSELPVFSSKESIDKFLQNEFGHISEVWHNGYNSSITPDSSMISLFAESDITDELPEKYTVSKPWEELTDLNMRVFNLTKEELSAILKENDIDFKSIDHMNFINTTGIIGAWGNDDLGNAEFVIEEDSIYYPDPNLRYSYEISADTLMIYDQEGNRESIQILRFENNQLILKNIDFDIIDTLSKR